MASDDQPPQYPPMQTGGLYEESTPPHGHQVGHLNAGQNAFVQPTSNPYHQAPQQHHPPGSITSPGFTPPVQPPAHMTGQFNANQLQQGAPIQPPAHMTGQFNANHLQQGSITSPGFTPPVQPPAHLTGQFNANQLQQGAGAYNTGQFTPPSGYNMGHTPAPHLTGGFAAPTGPNSGVSQQNMTGTFNAIHLQQGANALNNASEEPDSNQRISYGIWGGAVGAIVGVLLGVLNSILEGVPLTNAQTPLYAITIASTLLCGGVCAYAPQAIERSLKQYGVIGQDDE